MLWDLDGTLVDSAEQHWESWRFALEAEGLTISYEQFRRTFGMRNDAILSGWFGSRLSAADIRRIGDAKEEKYRELVARGEFTALPGGREWVRRLRMEGWRQAVASSAPRANVEVVVRALGLGEDFDALVAAEDVVRGKPDPEVFLSAATRLRVLPDRCVVVEDALAGIEAARRAGMRSVGIGTAGFAPADIVVHSLESLPENAFERLIPEETRAL